MLKPEYIDERIFDVYVDPSLYQRKSKVNLTWYAASLDENQVTLQLVFRHYEYISIEGLDELVVTVKDRDIFMS